MFKEAFKFMWYDRAKMFGILFGMILSVFLVGQQVMICLALLGGTVSLATFNKEYIWVVSDKSKQVTDLPFIDMRIARELRTVNGVKVVYPMILSAGTLKFNDGLTFPVSLVGTQAPAFAGGPWRVSVGKPVDMLQDEGVFLDAQNSEFGKLLKLGDRHEFNGKRIKIAGLTAKTEGLGNTYGFTTIERARYLCNIPTTQASAFLVKAEPGFLPEAVVANIAREIPGIKARTGEAFEQESLRYFAGSSGIVASFGLLVVFAVITGFAIVGLTMYSAVSDRLRDYGTLKAIGGTNATIRRLILSQAAIYALVGFGLAYGLLLFFINATKGSLDLQLTPLLSYSLVGVTLFIALLGSWFGMRRILKLEPAQVFRT